MGDRVSISFIQTHKFPNGRDVIRESVSLFHHWGGANFPNYALQWLKNTKAEFKKDNLSTPISRLEPETLIIQFLVDLSRNERFRDSTHKDRLSHSIYLGKDSNDGDNSDNGHFVIDIDKMEIQNATSLETLFE